MLIWRLHSDVIPDPRLFLFFFFPPVFRLAEFHTEYSMKRM